MRHIFTFSWLLLSQLYSSVTVSHADACTLKVFEKGSDQLIEGVCMEQFSSSHCRDFVNSFERSDLPDEFKMQDGDYSVEKPEPGSLKLIAKLSQHRRQDGLNLIPGMFVNWNSPASKSAKANIKGYLLIWQNDSSPSCRLYKFNSTDRERLVKELHFQSDIPYMSPNKHYTVRVYSMPPPESLAKSQDPDTFVTMNLTSGSVIYNYNNPGSWTPSLSAKVVTNGTVEVMVGHVPDVFNMSRFEVMLLQRSYDELNAPENLIQIYKQPPNPQSSVGMLRFSSLKTDEYKVVVHVLDDYHKEDGKCQCWQEETNSKRHCKLSCGSIGTNWFYVPGVVSIANHTSTEDPESVPPNSATVGPSVDKAPKGPDQENLIIGLTVGGALVVLLALAAYGLWGKYRNKKSGSSDAPTIFSVDGKFSNCEKTGFSPHSTGQLKTKTVYIVYAEDHPPDISFVEELSNFLQTHGQCHVVYPSAESIQSEDPVLSSRSAIDCADHILFLDSVAAEKFLASFNIKQVYVTRSLSPGNQFFKLALDHLYIFPQALDKVIMLSYRDKCGSLQYIKAPVNLRLPEDFRALLMRIHNLTEEDAEFYSHSLPLCSDNFESTTQGSRLCSALQAVKEYEHKNPEWFQTKIGEPRPILQTHISQGSEDTGISISSVPEDDFGDKRETDLFQPDQPMVTVGYQGIPRGSGDSETDSLVTVGVNFLNGPGHRQGMQGSEETQSSFMRSLVHPSAIEHSSVDFCLGIENINSEVDT